MEADDDTTRAVAQAKEQQRLELSGTLKAAGFDPGVPYYWIENHDVEAIRLSTFKDALFGSSYWEPQIVTLVHAPDDPTDSIRLPFVPELVEARYQPRRLGQDPDERPRGCFDYPHWYLRGHLWQSGFGLQHPHFTVHLYIVLDGNQADEILTIYLQLVAEPSGADPSTTMVEGTGAPGQDRRSGHQPPTLEEPPASCRGFLHARHPGR